MPDDIRQLLNMVGDLVRNSRISFWNLPEFWIGTALTSAGLIFSVRAFREAREAKRAATAAGRIVKIQTITIELTEVSQRLDRLRTDIHFNEARDMLNEVSRRLRRVISPFQKDQELEDTIVKLRAALEAAKKALNEVRPSDPSKEADAPYVVYNAIEADLATINGLVADLLGLFEKKTINFGDEHANA
jgi:hypothetical protein